MVDSKPCGEFHPLPCGLDVECPVPSSYFDVDEDSQSIVENWEAA